MSHSPLCLSSHAFDCHIKEGTTSDMHTALSTKPVLHAVQPRNPFLLFTDALDIGLRLGSGLCPGHIQRGETCTISLLAIDTNRERLCGHRKGGLAIKWEMETMRYSLWGAHFTVITNHAPLV